MKKIITEEQEIEIGKLVADHGDALVAFGADMYRDGLIKGAIAGVSGMTIGLAIGLTVTTVVIEFKNRNIPKKEES